VPKWPQQAAEAFAVEQSGDLAPDPVAGTVELVIGHSGDRGSGADLGDPVVGLSRVDAAMAHQLA
jgi:hypothetical protein